jgi:hypothetical protein
VQENFKLQRKLIRKLRLGRNMKDVLLVHDNAQPHTSLRTREAMAKMGWTVAFHAARSPDLAPSDYHPFDSVNNAKLGRHFADDNELKQFS